MKPTFGKSKSRSRSPIFRSGKKQSGKAGPRIFVAIEEGKWSGNRITSKRRPRAVRNVAITENGFSFEQLVQNALQMFNIPEEDMNRYCLVNGLGQELLSDEKYNGNS